MPSEFFTLETLATLAGMVAAVTLIVQFTKGIIKQWFSDYAVRLYTLIVAMVIMGFVLYVQGDLTAEAIGLGVINSFLVAVTSMGTYEVVADPFAIKKKMK